MLRYFAKYSFLSNPLRYLWRFGEFLRRSRRLFVFKNEARSDLFQKQNRTEAVLQIRPIWDLSLTLTIDHDEPKHLLELERSIDETLKNYVDVVRAFDAVTDSAIEAAESLLMTAKIDLVAGCEMARCGYLKQAYTLWRSWFEQSFFALYFLESPLNRYAWKVSDSVSLKDSPQYRLMLHQLLTESGEKHAFTLVYNERHAVLVQTLKASKQPKDQEPVKRAIRVLTQLSQGVHGTFRPSSMATYEMVCSQIGLHGTPALRNAWAVISEFWLLYIANVVDLPEDGWIALRSGELSAEQAKKYLGEEGEGLATLNESFKNAFQSLKNG